MNKTITYLIALVALMITSIGASAQGGLAPLVNSTHSYSVIPGAVGNTFAWTIVGDTPVTDYVLTNGTTTTASILWKTEGTYTLKFTETNATTPCNTVIQNHVVVGSNTFAVTTPVALAPMCNAASGIPNYGPATVATTVQFVVTMATGNANATFNPNWEFTFTLTQGTGATIGTVVSSAGTLSGTGPYTVTAVPSSGGAGTVTISLPLTADITTVNTSAILITSAKELQYKTPSNIIGNKTATQTVNAIPATTSIITD